MRASTKIRLTTLLTASASTTWFSLVGLLALNSTVYAATPPQISISQVPLELVIPAHPQVLFLVGNSESMDGTLSGAIMTGSGAGSAVTDLLNSSSPLCYPIPSGFTPPLATSSTSCPSGSAPYTVDGSNNVGSAVSGTLYDNSPSRLNTTKQALQAVINTYAATTDFGLMTSQVSSVSINTTWVYYMSDASGFTFGTSATPPSGDIALANPCYSNIGTDETGSDCTTMSSGFFSPGNSTHLGSQNYVYVKNTSDDPSINDVYYNPPYPPASSGSRAYVPSAFVTYNGPSPANPYTFYGLSQYESGGVSETYNNSIPTSAGQPFTTYPTNAGFVAISPQVMYAERGFGYSGTVSSNSASLLLSITSASTGNTPPTQAQINSYIATFTPFLKPETSSTTTTEIKSAAGQAAIATTLQAASQYYAGTNGYTAPKSNNGCAPLRFVVLVTDGLPTLDLSGNNWPPIGSAAAAGYGVTASFNADGSLNTTNDQALQDSINQITALNKAGIKTYVVGVGAGVDPSKNPSAAATLTAMAVAGGTSNYFPATNATQVAADLQGILSKIEAQNLATTAAAVNSTGLNTNTTVYQAKYTSFDTYGDWTGELLAFKVNSDGTVNTSPGNALWSAQTQLDNLTAGSGWQTSRFIATWNPTGGSSGTGAGVPFEWANINSTQQSQLMTSSTDTLGPARINYLRGDTSNEKRVCGTPSASCGGFRSRTHRLGDIVDSNPIYVGPPTANYQDPTYFTFKSNYFNRTPMIYVGADDGMLHAFNAQTGQEAFAFVPNGVFPNLINLTNQANSQIHQFYVDGSPAVADVQFLTDQSWHTVLVDGLNDGGNSIFALDVTNPAGWTSESAVASNVLWEFTDSTLGLTYSRPFIAPTWYNFSGNAQSQFVVFFGSGYNNSDGNDYIYALNARTGNLIAKLNLCAAVAGACNSSLPNGVSSVVAVSSSGGVNVPVDTLYAADLQGNLWKILLPFNGSSTATSNYTSTWSWSAQLLFQARDASGNPQPITTTPVVSLNPNFAQNSNAGPIVFFGTGQFLGTPDITNTNVQTFYAVDDPCPGTTCTGTLPTRSNGALVQQTLTDVTATVCVATGAPGNPPPCTNQNLLLRTVTNNQVNWNTVRGWYMDLPDKGERVITDPRLVSGSVVFTTYVPAINSCTGGGSAFLMDVNYLNGGSFPQPQLDISNSGNLNSNDQVNGQNPVGLGLGAVYASSPTIVTASMGNIGAVKLISESTGVIKSVKEHGPPSARGSWRQIY